MGRKNKSKKVKQTLDTTSNECVVSPEKIQEKKINVNEIINAHNGINEDLNLIKVTMHEYNSCVAKIISLSRPLLTNANSDLAFDFQSQTQMIASLFIGITKCTESVQTQINNLTKVNKSLTQQNPSVRNESTSTNDNVSQYVQNLKEKFDKSTMTDFPEPQNTSLIQPPMTPNKSFSNNKEIKIIVEDVPNNCESSDISNAISNLHTISISDITVHKKVNSKTNHKFNHILSLPSCVANKLIFDKILSINNNSFVVKPFIEIKRCFKCQSYGHMAFSCENNVVCANCSANHFSNNCNKPSVCANCIKSNSLNGTAYDFFHPAFASNCPYKAQYISYQRKIKFKNI